MYVLLMMCCTVLLCRSVAQHHDGVSGTARQAVTFDYAKRLAVGGAVADQMAENASRPAID